MRNPAYPGNSCYNRLVEFSKINRLDERAIEELSFFASSIIRKYYDPIIGKKQNDYHLEKFQSVPGLKAQLAEGYSYYLLLEGGERLGFLGYYPRNDALYLSKFYLKEESRGKGYGREAIAFLKEKAKELGLAAIELNVNRHNPTTAIYERLGFRIIRSEVIDIGEGFVMDDYVYRLEIEKALH